MTAPVDVLAVMEVAERFATAYNLPNTASDFASASAAIAELIAASSSYLELPTIEAADRLSAALSNVGGGQ